MSRYDTSGLLPFGHVRRNGYRADRRLRYVAGTRTASNGKTMCGAPATPDDHPRGTAAAWKEHAKFPQLAERMAGIIESVCPDCFALLTPEDWKDWK